MFTLAHAKAYLDMSLHDKVFFYVYNMTIFKLTCINKYLLSMKDNIYIGSNRFKSYNSNIPIQNNVYNK